MKSISLTTVGAVCALVLVIGFVAAIALTLASGVQTLIPETGDKMLEWLSNVEENKALFVASAWLSVFAGLFGLVAFIGFYNALREAGPVMIIAPIAGAVGLTLVTLSHLIPIAMANEIVPAYADAGDLARPSLLATADTLAMISAVTNYAGNVLGWGVTVPLYALAILQTKVAPRWIGWVGMVTALFAGWLGLISPISEVIEGLSTIGFLTFFVFMASLGTALLMRRVPAGAASRGPVAPVTP
jgi:hypothetical protein